MKLPPMPEPTVRHCCALDAPPQLWSADQLRAYGAACYAAGMDRAAEVCEERARHHDRYADARAGIEADLCADAIRAAKGTT